MKVEKAHRVVFWTGWVFLTLVLEALLRSSGGMPWRNALIFGAILSGVAQVSAWSAAFSCRTAPLARTPVARVLLIHITAAVALTVCWSAIGSMLARESDAVGVWSGTYTEFMQKRGLLSSAFQFYYLLSVAVQYALIAQKASS